MIDQLKQIWERLRSMKGFSTWLWIVILFVVLAIGLLLNDPLPVTPGESGGGLFGSTGLALSVFFRWIALIGFIYLVFVFFRKWQTNKTGPLQRRISISDRFYISPKQTLLIVKTNGKEFLVGATDSSIQLLAELDVENPPASEEQPGAADFESLLIAQKASQKNNDYE
jgi:flagellar biogenesis protein FliO